MSKYPNYKDSNVEWIGEIPEHWETSRLKFLCNITTGGKDTENKVDDGKYPFYVRSQTVERINSYSFNGEAILTAGDGVGVGKVFHYVNGKFDFHQRVYMFYAFKNVAGKFLFEYIKNNFYKVALAGVAKSTVDSLRLPLIQNFMITVPPLQEQQTIANYLDKATAKIDTLIEKQTKLVELLHEKRQAVISTAVTRGLDSTVAMKDSGVEWLGEIPEGWEAKKLKFISTVNDDTLPDSTSDDLEIKYIDIGSVTTGYIQSYEQMSYSNAPSRARRIIKDGDILVSTVRTYLKAIAPVSILYDNYIASTGFAVIRSGKELDSSFTKYALLSNYFIDLVESRSVGVSYPAINASDLVTFSIALPSIPEQQIIANYLDDKTSKIDTLITKATKAIDLLQEKRTALISSVVTGKIDVRWEVALG